MTSTALEQLKTLDPENIPAHATAEELRKRIEHESEEATRRHQEETKRDNDPRCREIYSFDFEWTDGRGKVWKGGFQSKILTIAQQQTVGALQATFAGGQSYESLDPLTRDINYAIAHMSMSLAETPRPAWAKDLRGLTDVNLILRLFREVAAHEATFHGRRPLEAPGGTGN